MAKLIQPNGITNVEPAGDRWQLDELQKIVGGYIEVVDAGPDEIAVVNEDGLAMELPLNDPATAYMINGLRPLGRMLMGSIVGPCIIMRRDELD